MFAKTKVVFAAATVLASAVLAGCGGSDSEGAGADGATGIKIATQPAITPDVTVPRYKKSWDAAGLKPKYLSFNDGAAMLAAFKAGDVDAGSLTAAPFLTAISQGIDLTIVATGPETGVASGLVTKNDSGYKSLEDLVGKKIGVAAGTGVAGVLDAELKKEGLKGKITVVNTPLNIQVTSFKHGDVDAVATHPPTSLVLQDEDASLVQTLADWGNPNVTFWVVRTDYLKENPEAVVNLLNGLSDGLKVIADGDQGAIDYQAKALNIEPAVVAEYQETAPFPTPQDWVSDTYELSLTNGGLEKFLQTSAEALVDLGTIPDVPDIGAKIDAAPAKQASAE